MNVRDVTREFKELPLGLIDQPTLPSRSQMDEEALDDLARDIRAKGVLLPLSVVRCDGRFEVVAGHRRWHAAKRAGLAVVPCVVYPSKDAAIVGVQYSENRFREELNAADEALWFSEILEKDCGGDVDRLCELLGEKRPYIENRLLLFRGDEKVFDELRAGRIRIGVAQQLNRCTEQQYRRYLLVQAIQGGATVAVVAGWISDWERQRQLTPGNGQAPTTASEPPLVPIANFFTCYICGGTEHVHLMLPVNVHTHCRLAILDKLLQAYHGESAS